MLVYQLDAYAFKDELFFWASLGYDYIGAPWMPHQRNIGGFLLVSSGLSSVASGVFSILRICAE